MERLICITFSETAPALISSTCLLSTWTAGSAETMNQPISIATGMSSQRVQPLARLLPSSTPSDEKPTFTPVRKITSPA